ncbi:MAG: glycine cleavage system protein GcvH [Bacteroidia bacterium]|jgi:glycine cleavage system H protein|nr:glycine cleavage system protein GcvH [Bacteroidales bacterium]MDD3299655.1 glycine cleavage system protein GcvH [Bacteroidales bacterium]MDD3843621.1 glycine cleavage system protein GcvH [Bacteroidales bacterium]MDD4618505.1 glycine cleavage system protein GcvH [Bacteroidales bacterium]NCC45873.1 glycine cleavage system protein GcvH [Bacteroidia bacterium]
MNIPANLKYSTDHEWIKIEGNIATVGITDFAQGQLGDIVFVDIQTEGETLEKGEVFGAIEAVKTVADAFMPLSGKITEVNTALEDAPETVNKDPYEGGWMVKIEMTEPSEADSLLDAEGYKAIL